MTRRPRARCLHPCCGIVIFLAAGNSGAAFSHVSAVYGFPKCSSVHLITGISCYWSDGSAVIASHCAGAFSLRTPLQLVLIFLCKLLAKTLLVRGARVSVNVYNTLKLCLGKGCGITACERTLNSLISAPLSNSVRPARRTTPFFLNSSFGGKRCSRDLGIQGPYRRARPRSNQNAPAPPRRHVY